MDEWLVSGKYAVRLTDRTETLTEEREDILAQRAYYALYQQHNVIVAEADQYLASLETAISIHKL